MEEKTLPWWRKALSYALGGLRSGFGLFSRSAKDKPDAKNKPDLNEPEIASAQQKIPEEEADLNQNSPELEPIVEAVDAVNEAVAAPLPVSPALPEREPELPVEEIEAAAPLPAHPDPAPQPEPEPQPAIETSAEEELPAAIAPEEAAEELPPPSESVPEFILEPAAEPSQEIASRQEAPVAIEASIEPAANQEPVPEPLAVTVEPSEPVIELEPEPEAASGPAPSSSIAEPASPAEPVEGIAPVPQSTSELADSFVQLYEQTMNETPEQTASQPSLVEEESIGPEETINQDESVSHEEPAVQEPHAPESALESITLPIEPNQQIPEPTPEVAQPAAVSEAASPETPANAPAPVDAPATEPAPEPQESTPIAAQSAAPTQPPAPTTEPPAKPFIKLESRDKEADLSPFSVIVGQVYDGPLDLLLDLIRKQDIDIYDIPIARITAQFLAYVNQLKATDVDVAGEFIYTASLLIHIKSKMLLPRAPSGPDDAAEDPRRELVERLLEHERFKNAAQMLQQKQMLEAATWTNPGIREFRDDAGCRARNRRRHRRPGPHLPRHPRPRAQPPRHQRPGRLGHRRPDDPVPRPPPHHGRQARRPAPPAQPHQLRARAHRHVPRAARVGPPPGHPAPPGPRTSARSSSRSTPASKP